MDVMTPPRADAPSIVVENRIRPTGEFVQVQEPFEDVSDGMTLADLETPQMKTFLQARAAANAGLQRR